jgi:hypothetical protein
VPDIGSNQQFEQAIAGLNNPMMWRANRRQRVASRSQCSSTRRIRAIPDFDEVKTKVEQSLKQERAKSQLEQKARELAGAINNPGEMKAEARRTDLKLPQKRISNWAPLWDKPERVQRSMRQSSHSRGQCYKDSDQSW